MISKSQDLTKKKIQNSQTIIVNGIRTYLYSYIDFDLSLHKILTVFFIIHVIINIKNVITNLQDH